MSLYKGGISRKHGVKKKKQGILQEPAKTPPLTKTTAGFPTHHKSTKDKKKKKKKVNPQIDTQLHQTPKILEKTSTNSRCHAEHHRGKRHALVGVMIRKMENTKKHHLHPKALHVCQHSDVTKGGCLPGTVHSYVGIEPVAKH